MYNQLIRQQQSMDAARMQGALMGIANQQNYPSQASEPEYNRTTKLILLLDDL
jgi:hypothetical protein